MELPDAEAAKLAARGDAGAFMVLVHRYRAPLIAYIHGRTRARDEAEDIAQDVLCKAWQHLPRLREPSAFAGWLFRIAGNAVTTAARRPRARPLDERKDGNPLAGSRAGHAVPQTGRGISSDTSVEIHAAVADLPEDQRTVVSLRHFAGFSNDQIAGLLEISPGTVRSRLSRAYAALRQRLVDRVEVP